MTPQELKSARQTLGITRYKFATLLSKNYRTIGRWESGETPIPVLVVIIVETLINSKNAA